MNKLKLVYKRQAGLTLVELLVSQAILGIVIVVVAYLWATISSISTHSNRVAAAADLVQDIRSTLSGRDQCKWNLIDKPFSATDANGLVVSKLEKYDSPSVSGGPFVQIGQTFDGLQLSDMRLRPIAQTGYIKIAAELELTFANNVSAQIAPRKIGVIVQVKRGKVADCWLREESEVLAANQNCKATTEGALDTFDAATNTCVLANEEWFEGSSDIARCPAGTRLPAEATSEYNCSVDKPPGFIDPYPKVPYTYDNGIVNPGARKQPAVSNVDTANQQCNCAYGVDLGPALIGSMKCRVRCQVL